MKIGKKNPAVGEQLGGGSINIMIKNRFKVNKWSLFHIFSYQQHYKAKYAPT